MNIIDAQKEMRDAYMGGGSGVLVSGLVWLTASIVAIYTSPQTSFMVFFVGGMMIHPAGILIDKLFKRAGKHSKENPLGKLAMESTIILFIGLYLAYFLFQTEPNWLYPIMLLMIGGRYLVFQTIYGMRIYWILGFVLIAAGFLGLNTDQPFHVFGLIGGMIELTFSILIILIDRRNTKVNA